MFSRILIKLVDQAIMPALLLLATRLISVILIANHFGINYSLSKAGFVYFNVEEFVLVNSYSTLSMICVLSIGLLYVLLKSFTFHDSHITPSLTAKLLSLRLSSFIQGSFDLYSQGAIWLSYSYLLMFVSAVMVYFGILYTWVFLVSAVLTVVSTTFFVLDIENEIFLKPSKNILSKESEFILKLEGLK